MEHIVKHDETGMALQFASEELRVDKDFVMSAIEHAWQALQWASAALRDDPEVVRHSFQDGEPSYNLGWASERLRADRDFMADAVGVCGNYLFYASDELKDDAELVMQAVASVNSWQAIKFASPRLKNDRDFVLRAAR